MNDCVDKSLSNKEKVLKMYSLANTCLEAYFQFVDELYDQQYVYEDLALGPASRVVGLDALKSSAFELKRSLPDCKLVADEGWIVRRVQSLISLELVIAEGQKVVVRWTGTQAVVCMRVCAKGLVVARCFALVFGCVRFSNGSLVQAETLPICSFRNISV
jgi:hypothetical protein